MKVVKPQKPINKTCLRLVDAFLKEDTDNFNKMLKTLVLTNIRKKFKKAERETDLF